MNIRQVRKKIRTVIGVKKITKAMQLVAAVKMKKAQQQAIEGRPFQQKLEEIIGRISTKVDTSLSILLSIPTAAERNLAILISTKKGLCGPFNLDLFRYLSKNIDFQKTDFVTLGRKGSLFLGKIGGTVLADFSEESFQASVSAIFTLVLDKFQSKEYKEISLIYNKFISPFRFEPIKETLLPFKIKFQPQIEQQKLSEYLIEPSPQKLIDPLLRSYLEEKIRFALIESEAGEHSARMMAMKNATDNANDLIYNLVLLRNKLRQEKITYELLDMVTATQSIEQK